MTAELLALASLAPCAVLDMGAGDGESAAYLCALGFDARGVDLTPGAGVEKGDFLRCPYPDGAFGAVLSECAMFVSGDRDAALREAYRLLESGGTLLLADVFFAGEEAARREAEAAGFRVTAFADKTAAWREYYIGCVWDGTADALCACVPKGRCGYYFMVCGKEDAANGRV